MTSGIIALVVIGLLILLILFFLISVYNELTKERILTQEAASGVGTVMQERNDLIPNLVETVKGYAGHENKTLTEVVRWRNQSAAATTVEEQSQATQGLDKALVNMVALTESYPDLKANGNFQELMGQLSRVEQKMNDARRYYNGTVREFNQSIAVFPKNVVANSFGFKPAIFFAEDTAARTVPQVKF